MALNHFSARHFAARHFGTLHGQAATAPTIATGGGWGPAWPDTLFPATRRVRARAWAEWEVYGRCTARQIPPPRLARARDGAEAEQFHPCRAHAGPVRVRTRTGRVEISAHACRARAIYRTRAGDGTAHETYAQPRGRRGVPGPAVLTYFLREIA